MPAACNQVFNVGADQPYSVNELARAVAARDGRRPRDRAPAGAPRGAARALVAPKACAASSASARRRRSDDGLRADGRVGAAARRARQRRVRAASRSRRTFRPSWQALMTGATTTAHLPRGSGPRAVWQVVAEHLAPLGARRRPTSLELGAGYCHWINNVRAARRVAVDIWPELPRLRRSRRRGAACSTLSLGLGAFGDGSFDVVLASNFLEHFAPDAVARRWCDEVGRLLKPRRPLHHRPAELPVRVPAATSTTTRIAPSSPTCRSRRCCARTGSPSTSSGRGSCRTRCARARLPITTWLVRAYLRSPFKPMAGQMLVVGARA